MSLLGPDDFGLGRKGRIKKLAKDLSPALQKEMEKWLDEMDEIHALERITQVVGPEEAQKIISNHRMRKRHLKRKDLLSDF